DYYCLSYDSSLSAWVF
nr:immunoglobulin light chain junction region [Macaca mulatta]MOV94428.1 immunoglobulin light chain junction region [Macaca mulatta]MOV94565.1 immunoglobulin light chain junction region [Macaca mulatta]MOV94606.1 immunoglobulin light chain junction region [Macaca mulatta]MOV94829.1 immunoglobulin light chain junction region [Macaca mulatta]